LVHDNRLFLQQPINDKFQRRYSWSKSRHFDATIGKETSDCDSDAVFVDEFLSKVQTNISDEILPNVLNSWNRPPESPLILLLCVSGGCDSVALFYSMMHLLKSIEVVPNRYRLCLEEKDGAHLPCEVHVVHFDHQQRGEESDRDRLLVQQMCSDYNIPFHCYYWEDANRDIHQRKFSQEMARDWRKSKTVELLSTIMGSTPSRGLILTAHHRDDSVETVVLKMLRGVHLTNISGMASVQQDRYNNRIFIGKPMLQVGKKDIEKYLILQHIPWREDSSNQSSKYLRNRVRNELIPLLNELVGGETILYSRLINAQEQSRKLKDDVTQRADFYLQSYIANSDISHYPVPQHGGPLTVVEEEALYKWVELESRRRISLTYEKLLMICRQLSEYPDRRKWNISIGNEWKVARDGDVLILLNDLEFDHARSLQSSQNGWTFNVVKGLPGDNRDSVHTKLISLALGPGWNGKNPVMSLQKVNGNESLKFIPYWRKGKREMKIKEFLRGQRVPLHRRGEAPILCLEGDDSLKIAAVFVESEGNSFDQGGRWVMHADFHVESDSVDESVTIALKRSV
jgi:tRNA(Ile)-lysidine synthetase, N-terminal domain